MVLAVTAGMTTILQAAESRLVRLVSITRRTKTTLYFTETNQDIVFDSNTYKADLGIEASSVTTSSELNLQSMVIHAFENDFGVKREDVLLGEFVDSEVIVRYVDFDNLGDGSIIIFKGLVGDHGFQDTGLVEMNVESRIVKKVPIAGETYSPTCRNVLGDTLCTVDMVALRQTFTITAVNGTQTFTTSLTGLSNMAEGVLKFTSGNNEEWACEILSYNSSTGVFRLFLPPPLPMQVGDTGEAYPGCSKTISFCHSIYNNVRNFRGEPIHPLGDSIPEGNAQVESTPVEAAGPLEATVPQVSILGLRGG